MGDVIRAGVRHNRRRPIISSQDDEAPVFEDIIDYYSVDGKATGDAVTTGSKTHLKTKIISGRTIGQKVFVVSGTVFGNATASGSITTVGVNLFESSGSRIDNDFVLTDAVICPVVVDNDLP